MALSISFAAAVLLGVLVTFGLMQKSNELTAMKATGISIYRTIIRSGTSPLLDLLDCPDPSTTAPLRSVTTTPKSTSRTSCCAIFPEM